MKSLNGIRYKARNPRLMVLVFTLVPFAGFIATIFQLSVRPATLTEIVLFVFVFFLGELGFEAGLHRCFAHGAFRPKPVLKVILALLGSMSAKSTIADFAAYHRRHHSFADKGNDPHSPNQNGISMGSKLKQFFFAYYGWMLTAHDNLADGVLKAKILQDPVVRFFSDLRIYTVCVVIGILVPGLIYFAVTHSISDFFRGILFFGLTRVWLQQQSAFIINTFSHLWGRRDFDTNDRSTNSFLISALTMGIGWHNNHHAFPWTASNSFKWWQFDPIGRAIILLSRLKLADQVRRPTRAEIDGFDQSLR